MEPVYYVLIFNVVIFVGGQLYAWGRFRAAAVTKEELARRLYNANGTPIYVTREECEKSQENCGRHLCQKIDGLRKDHKEFQEAHLRSHEDITRFLGSVEQFIKDRGRN